MSGFVKNKKLLFDGAESDFYVFSSTLDTKDFGSVLFDNRKVQYLWGLGAKRGQIYFLPPAIRINKPAPLQLKFIPASV